MVVEMGVWDMMKRGRVNPFFDMKVWDEVGGGGVQFSYKDTKYDELGFIIENHVIQTALNEGIRGMENIEVNAPKKIVNISFPTEYKVRYIFC